MMGQSIKVNGMKIRSRDKEHIAGLMEDSFKENGLTTIWKAWVCIPGLMVDAIWANTKMTRNMDMEYTNGLMAEFT